MTNFTVCAYNLQGLVPKPEVGNQFTYNEATMGGPYELTVDDDDIYAEGLTPDTETNGSATYVSGSAQASWAVGDKIDLNAVGVLQGSDGSSITIGWLEDASSAGLDHQMMTDAPLVDGVNYEYISATSAPAGGTYDWADFNFAHTPPPCFTPGSLIETAKGLVAIETLQPEDLVLTRDNGYQPVKWIYSRALSKHWFNANVKSCPIVIAAGSLGPNMPDRDLMVSPGHMMLLVEGSREFMVPASNLVTRDGVHTAKPHDTGYLHLLFEQHQVVKVGGVWSETLQPSMKSYKCMGWDAVQEIWNIFPELSTFEGVAQYERARDMIYHDDAAQAVARLHGQQTVQ